MSFEKTFTQSSPAAPDGNQMEENDGEGSSLRIYPFSSSHQQYEKCDAILLLPHWADYYEFEQAIWFEGLIKCQRKLFLLEQLLFISLKPMNWQTNIDIHILQHACQSAGQAVVVQLYLNSAEDIGKYCPSGGICLFSVALCVLLAFLSCRPVVILPFPWIEKLKCLKSSQCFTERDAVYVSSSYVDAGICRKSGSALCSPISI